jgi:hypothetical protein
LAGRREVDTQESRSQKPGEKKQTAGKGLGGAAEKLGGCEKRGVTVVYIRYFVYIINRTH